MPRELSTKWWNVIRRQMRATAATDDPTARCPDCNGMMWLMEGRYGRYYTCQRLYQCKGTLGARLDGSVIAPRGTAVEMVARDRARLAVSALVDARREWELANRREGHFFSESVHIADDLNAVIEAAKLPRVLMALRKKDRLLLRRGILPARVSYPLGLHIRRRTIEECERIRIAAEDRTRRYRQNAWDRLTLDTFEEHREGTYVAVPKRPSSSLPAW